MAPVWRVETISGTLNVGGNLTWAPYYGLVNGGTIAVAGNVEMTASMYDYGTSTVALVFDGAGAQTIDAPNGYHAVGNVTVSKATGTLTLSSNLTLPGTTGFEISSGTVDLSGHALSVGGVLQIDAAGILNVDGGSYSPSSGPNFIDNGTINP
jgi:hypothetical protein